MPDYLSPELVAACHRADARQNDPFPDRYEPSPRFTLKYRTVTGWHTVGPFNSVNEAEDYRLAHFPTSCEWDVLKHY